jgi:hypothetical protein
MDPSFVLASKLIPRGSVLYIPAERLDRKLTNPALTRKARSCHVTTITFEFMMNLNRYIILLKKIQRISPSGTQPTAIGDPWTMDLEDLFLIRSHDLP